MDPFFEIETKIQIQIEGFGVIKECRSILKLFVLCLKAQLAFAKALASETDCLR